MEKVTLYHGDCLEVMATLPAASVDAIVTDPPYGIALATNYAERKRGALAQCNNFKPIANDERPFDPTHLLGYRTVVLFGANYYAHELPVSGGWVVWDKLDGLQSNRELGFNDNSDAELIWTNKGASIRIIRHRWMGAMKGSEHQEGRVHPTQKPIKLMRMLVRHYTKPGDTVLDPYMGSGTTGVACVLEGRRFIGIELERQYYDIAERRISEAAMQPPLFSLEADSVQSEQMEMTA